MGDHVGHDVYIVSSTTGRAGVNGRGWDRQTERGAPLFKPHRTSFVSFTLFFPSLLLVLESSRKTKHIQNELSRLVAPLHAHSALSPPRSFSFAMSHQRAASTSSISSNNSSDTHHRSNSVRFATGGMADNTANGATNSAAPSSPLSISIPRQRSFSSSLSFAATSPSARTFTGSSIITNSSNGYFNSGVSGGPTTPLSAVFVPLSPATANPPTGAAMTVGSLPSSSVTTGASQAMPGLHRRFSSSFHQLNQMAGTTPNNGSVGPQVKNQDEIFQEEDWAQLARKRERQEKGSKRKKHEGPQEDHKTETLTLSGLHPSLPLSQFPPCPLHIAYLILHPFDMTVT